MVEAKAQQIVFIDWPVIWAGQFPYQRAKHVAAIGLDLERNMIRFPLTSKNCNFIDPLYMVRGLTIGYVTDHGYAGARSSSFSGDNSYQVRLSVF